MAENLGQKEFQNGEKKSKNKICRKTDFWKDIVVLYDSDTIII